MGLLQFSCAMVSLQRYVGYVIPKTMRKLELFYENSSNNVYRCLFKNNSIILFESTLGRTTILFESLRSLDGHEGRGSVDE